MANAAPLPVSSGGEATDAAARTERVPVSQGVFLLVAVLGCLITAVIVWTSWALNHRNENRLLKVQTEQAGVVLLAALPSTETPLASAAAIASATDGGAPESTRYISAFVGQKGEFSSASLFELNGTSLRRVSEVASSRNFAAAGAGRTRGQLLEASRRGELIVSTVFKRQAGPPHARLCRSRHALGASRSMPSAGSRLTASRASPRARPSPISITPSISAAANAVQPAHLRLQPSPATGDTAKVTVPFGDSDITIVTAARGQLAGTLPALLPWIFGALGLLLTIAAAWTAERLVRRRRSAERDTDEIGRLYGELGTLYGEQRTIALTLQRALLPSDTPEIAGLEVAVQYVPGTTGMEIGGDWYSVIALDEQRSAFVIGDVFRTRGSHGRGSWPPCAS